MRRVVHQQGKTSVISIKVMVQERDENTEMNSVHEE